MSQVDEGLIHAWLDGQLPADEAARIERLVATDADWGAAAADARGVVAGASRVLGALDDVPSVRQPGSIGTATRARRSVWRAPWLRAAAGIALVAGVGSLVARDWPSAQNPDQPIAADATTDTVRGAPVQAAPPPAGATGESKAAAPDSRNPLPKAPAVREPPKRDEASAAKVESRLGPQRVVGGAGAVSSTGPVAPAGAGAAVATTQNIRVDSLRISALALQKPSSVAASADAGGTGVGGGRGARAASGSAPLNAAATARQQTSAESLTEPQIIDLRISGCWFVLDSVPSRAYVVKFVDPIATDIQRAAARPLVERGSVAPMAVPREMPRAPVGARVQNTSPRMISADSSFSAEWITGNELTTLLFTVHGDTLAGTTRRSAGDIAHPIVAVRAARVQCPQ